MKMLPLRLVLGTAIVAILGSLWYYAFPVTGIALTIILVIAIVIAAWFPLSAAAITEAHPTPKLTPVLLLLAIVALGAWWNAVLAVEITDAVRSPWLVLSPFSIVSLGVAVATCALLFVQRAHRAGIVILGAVLFSVLSMAAVVYPHGIGFDPFLHRATVAHIAAEGSITPKPLYYIGQYALELVLVLVGNLPLVAVDRFLLPVFATVALLASAWYGFAPIMKKHGIALVALVLLPLGAFVSTTPQGIAYVFALSAIFLTFQKHDTGRGAHAAPWLLATAAMLTHPFAGIPALLYVAAWYALQRIHRSWTRRVVLVASGVAACTAIPVLFAFQAARSGLALQLHLGNLFDASRWSALALDGFFHNQFSPWYDGLYLVVGNMFLLTILLGIAGFFVTWRAARQGTNGAQHVAVLPIIFAAGMFANFLALSIVFDFDFLIAYERSDYAVRALTLTQLFFMPAVMVAVAAADEYVSRRPRALRMAMLMLLAAVGAANVYGAYPRHDNYARSAGFNVSTADFNAVAAIAQHADTEENYIVLANQATSAAAVESYGFRKYYHTDIFYYPIPTGGPMYEQFLSMVNVAPTRDTMLAAMDIASDPSTGTSVDLAYFAVSDYWWKSDVIIENAKREADDWFAVDGGKVTVFIFRR